MSSSSAYQMPQHGTPCWVQIPARDMHRAIAFYRAALDYEITYTPPASQGSMDMAFIRFPGESKSLSGGGIVRMQETSESAAESMPVAGRALLYLYTPDLEPTLDRISEAGGKVVMPRTKVAMGWQSEFCDTEGNLVGLCTMTPPK